MTRIYFTVLGILIVIAFSGFYCSSVSQSGAKGDTFYTHLKNGNYEMIIGLLDEQAIKVHPKEKWLNLFRTRYQYWGKLVSYKNTGFHTESTSGEVITHLDYTVENVNGKAYERIDLIKRGSDFKIMAYEFNSDKDNLSSNN